MNPTKSNPFSLYDFLGYFTPGAILLYSLILTNGFTNMELDLSKLTLDQLEFNSGWTYIPFAIMAYTTGHLLNYISSITIEKYAIWMYGYPSKYLLGTLPDDHCYMYDTDFCQKIMRSVNFIILVPISIFDIVTRCLTKMQEKYSEKLDQALIATINKKITNNLSVQLQQNQSLPLSSDVFRYIYHHSVEKSGNHLQKMQNYVALFGFLRTITLICVVWFWASLRSSDLFPLTLTPDWQVIITAALAFSFFMAFMKIYRRFTLEGLMAFIVTD